MTEVMLLFSVLFGDDTGTRLLLLAEERHLKRDQM